MGKIRQIAGPAAAFTLLATGCLSTEESLFRNVAAPPEAAEQGSAMSRGASSRDVAELVRVLEGLAPITLAPPAVPVVEVPAAGLASSDEVEGSALAPIEIEASETQSEACAAPGLLLCDTFDGGELPEAGQWQAELPGCGTHFVEEGAGLSGSKGLRTDAGGYPECMLHADLEGEAEVFVRSWIRLGSEPDLLRQYLSLLEWGPAQARDEPELRIGLRPSGGSLCPASPGLDVTASGLGEGSATDCTGFVFEPERWYCVQAHLSRGDEQLSISLVVDGEPLLELEYTELAAAWKSSSLYFKLGRAAYGASAVGSLFHDDVAVGREPVPCGP